MIICRMSIKIPNPLGSHTLDLATKGMKFVDEKQYKVEETI